MGAPTPNVIITPFGEGNAGSITLPIPVPSQLPGNPGYASFTDGFPSDTSGAGSLPPRWQDMQGILYMVSAYCQALTGGQVWQFNSTWEAANSGYALGAQLAMAANNGIWINLSNGNSNNPDTTAAATSNWAPLEAYGITAITGLTNTNVTLTAPQAACPIITLAGTLTANVQIIFPTWLKQWKIVNLTTGAFTITCKTASGTGVVIPQGGVTLPIGVYGDGTNIQPANGLVSSTFNVAWTGFSSAPGGVAAQYVTDGYRVTLTLPGGSTGTSNSSSFGISNLPASITPFRGQTVWTSGYINGGSAVSTPVAVGILSNGTINFVLPGTTWSASGNKGIDSTYAAMPLTYLLT